uniref:Uncharacterized protein n=1 Tax=Anopheles maculatus TaxID=74869 RepID=A0A182S7C3_9DIPT
MCRFRCSVLRVREFSVPENLTGCSYEQGLEDYDEAADRAEREQQAKQKEQSVEHQYNNMVKPMLTLFNVISTVLSSGRSMRSMASSGGPERIATGDEDGNPGDGGNKTEIITFGEKSTSGANGTGGGNENGNEYFECLAYFPNAAAAAAAAYGTDLLVVVMVTVHAEGTLLLMFGRFGITCVLAGL